MLDGCISHAEIIDFVAEKVSNPQWETMHINDFIELMGYCTSVDAVNDIDKVIKTRRKVNNLESKIKIINSIKNSMIKQFK